METEEQLSTFNDDNFLEQNEKKKVLKNHENTDQPNWMHLQLCKLAK